MGDKMNKLELIKESLERNVGNEIVIKFNKGRRQVFQKELYNVGDKK